MKNQKYFVALFLAVAFILTPVLANAQTLTIAELQAQIAALQRQLAILLGQQDNTGTWCHTFNTNLSIGMSGGEVSALQTALTRAGFGVNATGSYDENTAAAVSGFQLRYRNKILTPLGLQNPTGYAGPATRAVMNRLYGCGNVVVPPPQPPATPTLPPSVVISASSKAANLNQLYAGALGYVSGQNFLPNNTVYLKGDNNNNASINVRTEDDRLIVFTVPQTLPSGFYWLAVSNANGISNSLTVTIVNSQSVLPPTAAPYTLTTATTGVLGSGSGTITKSPNQTSYAAGAVVTLTATPAAGSTFVGWSGNLTHLVSPATITMNGDKTVTAIFAAASTLPPTQPASITVSSPNSGSYAAGASLPVAWTWANIPSSTLVNVYLFDANNSPNVGAPGLVNTANDGSATLSLRSDAPAGQYRVRITATVNGQSVLAYGGWINISVTAPATYPIIVGVKNVNTGVMIAGATVRVTGNGLDRTFTTPSNGQTNTYVPPGSYTLTVSATNYQTQTQAITIINSGYNWQPSLTPTTAPATPSFTVTSPSNNQQWTSANGPVIQWSSANIPSGNQITVELLTPSNGQVPDWSNFSTANDGSESGRLTNSSVASGWYYFRLSTVVNGQTIYGGSGVFQFSQPAAAATPVVVTAPTGGENWLAGSSQTVRWTENIPDPYPQATVIIDLAPAADRNNRFGYNFSSSHDGQETIIIPSSVSAGNFVVVVLVFGQNSINFGYSNPIQIIR